MTRTFAKLLHFSSILCAILLSAELEKLVRIKKISAQYIKKCNNFSHQSIIQNHMTQETGGRINCTRIAKFMREVM